MRLLSAPCSCCGKRRSARLGDLLLCPDCDTSPDKAGEPRRGAPPNMPGARGGYVYAEQDIPRTER